MHYKIVNPPYVNIWAWGNLQKEDAHETGSVLVEATCGSVNFSNIPTSDDDHKEGATGILHFVTTDQPATFDITAIISHQWQYAIQAWGPFSNAVAKGGVDMVARRKGVAIDGPRRAEFFSDSSRNAGRTVQDGGGVKLANVRFDIAPGEEALVGFGAWLDLSHDSGWGTAGGGAFVKCNVTQLQYFKWPH